MTSTHSHTCILSQYTNTCTHTRTHGYMQTHIHIHPCTQFHSQTYTLTYSVLVWSYWENEMQWCATTPSKSGKDQPTWPVLASLLITTSTNWCLCYANQCRNLDTWSQGGSEFLPDRRWRHDSLNTESAQHEWREQCRGLSVHFTNGWVSNGQWTVLKSSKTRAKWGCNIYKGVW